MDFDRYSGWHSRRSRYDNYEEDDEDEEDGDGDSEVGMEEVIDEELSLEHWADGQGRKLSLSKIHLDECEVLGADR